MCERKSGVAEGFPLKTNKNEEKDYVYASYVLVRGIHLSECNEKRYWKKGQIIHIKIINNY